MKISSALGETGYCKVCGEVFASSSAIIDKCYKCNPVCGTGGDGGTDQPPVKEQLMEEEQIEYIVRINSKLYEAYYDSGFTGADSVKLTAAHGLKLVRGEGE